MINIYQSIINIIPIKNHKILDLIVVIIVKYRNFFIYIIQY